MGLLGRILRWLLVPASAIAVVGIAVAAGRSAVALIDGRCPPQSMVGGACVEPWHTGAVEMVIYAATGVGALALAVIPALIAPSLKRSVAGAGALLGVGAVSTFYVLTTWPVVLPLLALALVAGGLGFWWTWRRSIAHAPV